jgi:signal transduction histidine kinase
MFRLNKMTTLNPDKIAKIFSPLSRLVAVGRPTFDLWQTLKAIEWILLAITVIFIVVSPSFYHSTTSSIITGITAIGLFVLSLNPPIDRPLRWRQIYIFCSLGIANIGDGTHSSFSFVASFILLKACLLLPRRDVIWIALVAWLMMMVGINLRMPNNFALLRQFGVEPFLDPNKILVNNTFAHIGNCVFILLPGFVWVEEQRSRQRAEKLAKEVEVLAADLERSRIARDIHDALGHSLTTLDIQLELAQNIYDRDPLHAAKSIDIAKQLSSKCLQDVRYALRSLHRSNFDLDRALVTSIERFQYERECKIHYHLDFPQLPHQIGHQLYCVVLESLTNVQKHADASRVEIVGTTVPEGISLTIVDNGKGFDPALPASGYGLQNMRDRVLSLGGRLTISSQPHTGAKIEVLIPFQLQAVS